MSLEEIRLSIESVAQSIETWINSAASRGDIPGIEWYFPAVETCHVICLAVVVCTIAMVDLRLLGLWARHVRVATLTSELLPWTWVAWCGAALFGLGMFVTHAHGYLTNRYFILKFVCMGLAGVNMAVFHLGAFKHVADWDTGEPVPAAKWAGGISAVLWVAVVFFGRYVGFSEL